LDNYKAATEFLEGHYQRLKIEPPKFHIVLGSAIGGGLDSVVQQLGRAPIAGYSMSSKWEKLADFPFSDVPGLPTATVAGHKGHFSIFVNTGNGKSVIFQGGRVHGYEGHSPRKVVLPVMASRLAGTKNFILTNAAGSLNAEMEPGSAMVIRDHVNMTGHNPLVGENPKGNSGQELGPRFPDMSCVYDKDFRALLVRCLEEEKMKVDLGVYLGLLGPTYETPSEVQLFSKWGMDAVGMSTVWEAIALKHSGARIGGISLLTNYACGLVGEEVLDHEDLLKNTKTAAEKVIRGLFRFLEKAI